MGVPDWGPKESRRPPKEKAARPERYEIHYEIEIK